MHLSSFDTEAGINRNNTFESMNRVAYEADNRASLGQSFVTTAIVCLALTIAALVIISSTMPPAETKTSETSGSLESPSLSPVGPVSEKPNTRSARTHVAQPPDKTGGPLDAPANDNDTIDWHAANQAADPRHNGQPAIRMEDDRFAPTDEPITSRPVANRFDFITPPIHTTVTEFKQNERQPRFATVPATKLEPVRPEGVSVVKSLPQAKTLNDPAQGDQTVPDSSARVAGWQQIRAIEIGELNGNDEPVEFAPAQTGPSTNGVDVNPPATPVALSPESGPSKPAQKRQPSRSYSKKSRKKKTSKATIRPDQTWQHRALFRD